MITIQRFSDTETSDSLKKGRTHSGLSYEYAVPEKRIEETPLLFVPGMGGGKWQFRQWLIQCAQMGIEAYALDLRGHGESRCNEYYGKLSIYDYVHDIYEMAFSISKPLYLVGHSMGAVVSQRFTAEFSGSRWVKHLVSLNSSAPQWVCTRGPILRRIPRPYYLKAMLFGLAFTFRPEDEDLFLNRAPEYQGKSVFGPESGRAAREIVLWRIPVAGNSIHCPHLVVSGRYDRAAVPTQQLSIHRKFKGSTYLGLECGHMPMLEDRDGKYLETILSNVLH